MRTWIFASLLVARSALAETADLARDALADQVKAIGASDAKAFAAGFGADAFVILPTAAGEARGKPAIEAAVKAWLASVGKVTVVAEAPRCGEIYMGAGSWCSTTITAKADTTTIRWRALIVVEKLDSGHAILVEHLSEAFDDKIVLAAAAAGKLPVLPTMPKQPPSTGPSDIDAEHRRAPDQIASFARAVEDSPAAVLIGSAPDELYVGKTAVAARLKAWKTLKLSLSQMRVGHAANDMIGIDWVAGDVEATYKVGGKSVKVPYRTLAVYFTGPAAAEQPMTLECAHFSVAMH